MNVARSTLRVGIVGAGSMGRNHARVASSLKQVSCAGVFDPNPSAGNAVASQFDIEYYDSFERLIDNVDAVVIAAPTSTHFDLAKEAIGRGIHCLIEKPITVTTEEAEELLTRAEAAKVIIQVGHVERYNPIFSELGKIIEGEEILAIKASRLSYNIVRANDVDVVLDLMIHDIDTVVQLLRGHVEIVSAVGGRYLSPTTDYVTALMRSPSGIVAELTASKVSQTKHRELVLSCKDCFIRVDYLGRQIEILRHSSGRFFVDKADVRYRQEALIERVFVPNVEPLVAEHLDFAQSVTESRQPLVSGYDGLVALKFAKEIQGLCKNG